MPESRGVVHALGLGPRGWFDLSLAALELGRARWRLGRHSARDLIEFGRRQALPGHAVPPAADAIVERVAFAIPRVAARVPWRADCWVQALAAQAWLGRAGVPSDVWIGTRSDRGGFEAHAWLRSADRIVTGGAVEGWTPLLTPQTRLP